ncbi:unnamed protein product [Cuscuta epithymum]|uniref:Uncharacterized protein n=1 Tax=Cuscuta epithymum TaxID=186058 RepID=A0AAV0EA05_9ASTE|nr:unnamed protein product [Cuscuta epithymum]
MAMAGIHVSIFISNCVSIYSSINHLCHSIKALFHRHFHRSTFCALGRTTSLPTAQCMVLYFSRDKRKCSLRRIKSLEVVAVEESKCPKSFYRLCNELSGHDSFISLNCPLNK